MVKTRKRAKKGSVSIRKRGDYLQLRWSVQGHEYSISAGKNTPLNHFNAREAATQIERDIENRVFDPTLARYRGILFQSNLEPAEERAKPKTTLELFLEYSEHRRQLGTSAQAISTRYNALAANLERFGRSIESEVDAMKFVEVLRSRQTPLVANQNLSLLKGFGDWAVSAQIMPVNWFKTIKKLKESKVASPKRRPFTRDEINRLLATAKTHPQLCQWHDFCMLLLYLGLRPSEAIGLRWQDIDLHRGEVTIALSLARDGSRGRWGRSAGTSRVRKSTKNEISRILSLQESLMTMLKDRNAALLSTTPTDLVFRSPKGKPIDDHSFSQDVWKPLCNAAGVSYRVPYACRHTVLSHGLESGTMTQQQAAYTAGHTNTRTVNETYSHMLNRPKLIDWQKDL